jgi:hypothetical protein
MRLNVWKEIANRNLNRGLGAKKGGKNFSRFGMSPTSDSNQKKRGKLATHT